MSESKSSVSLGRRIASIYRHQQIVLNQRLNKYGLGSGQFYFLIAVAKQEGLSQKDLTELFHIDKATTAKALRKLEEHDYIRRESNPEDRRCHKLYLTETGRNIIPTLKDVLNEQTDILSMGIPEDELKVVYATLDKMEQNINDFACHLKDEEV